MSHANASAWRPTGGLGVAKLRAAMLRDAREYFAQHGILEVNTPILSTAAASDVHIESVAVALGVRPGQPYYLHTSPEFAMKRLLCAGWPDIYQVCTVFRDSEIGKRHQPEFTMIEWYRLDMGFTAMMAHTVEFLTVLLKPAKLRADVDYLDYAQAFQQSLGIDPFNASIDDLRTAGGADADVRAAIGDQRDDWLDYLLSARVAPSFAGDRLTVLHHYPASQAALARLCPAVAGRADRFEVFCGELELANGYAELCDADEQAMRCRKDQALRHTLGRRQRPLDHLFFAALSEGLPDCCGVAVGFDRLVMINAGTQELRDVQLFPAVSDDNP